MPSHVLVGFALLASTIAALAQAPAEFPAEAKNLTADALQQRVAGKVFNVKPVAGPPWRLQFQANGYYFINVGSYSDSGKWRTEDSGLCTAPQKRPASCNEMRLASDALYLKRDSGEIVKFEPN